MGYLFCGVCAFAGSILQTVTGFGLAILVMALLPLSLPFSTSLAISSLLGAGHSVIALFSGGGRYSLSTVLPPTAAYFTVSTLAARFLSRQPEGAALRFLGAFLILLSLYFLFGQRRLTLRPSVPAGLLAGAASGITGGLFSVTGPPLVVYYLAAAKDSREYLANIRLTFLLTGFYTLGLRIWHGALTPEVGRLGAAGLLAMALGVLAGNRLLDRIDPETLKKAVYATMLLSGAIYLLQ